MKDQDCFHCADKAGCKPYGDVQKAAEGHGDPFGWMPAPGVRLSGCPLKGENMKEYGYTPTNDREKPPAPPRKDRRHVITGIPGMGKTSAVMSVFVDGVEYRLVGAKGYFRKVNEVVVRRGVPWSVFVVCMALVFWLGVALGR